MVAGLQANIANISAGHIAHFSKVVEQKVAVK
jgi:hypothetical protein